MQFMKEFLFDQVGLIRVKVGCQLGRWNDNWHFSGHDIDPAPPLYLPVFHPNCHGMPSSHLLNIWHILHYELWFYFTQVTSST